MDDKLNKEILNPESIALQAATQDYYAIMSWKGLLTATQKWKIRPVILRYKCPEAKQIVISKFVHTFIYFCPASKTWDIHEIASGVRIEGGTSIAEAVKKTIEFFKECDEHFFFVQLTAMGPHENHKGRTVMFDTAMDYLKAGEKENKRAAELRRILEHRKSKGSK